MNLEVSCQLCGQDSPRVEDVVLARRLPAGDGTLTYMCSHSAVLLSVRLTFDDVMAAVFAGAKPVDVEFVRQSSLDPSKKGSS